MTTTLLLIQSVFWLWGVQGQLIVIQEYVNSFIFSMLLKAI